MNLLARARTWMALAAVAGTALAVADLVRPRPWLPPAFVALVIVTIVLVVARREPKALVAGPGDGAAAVEPPPSLGRLFRQGLRMGLVAFGGAMAVIAAIERELVDRLRWVSHEAYTEAAALGQSLPGAMANNALALLGYRLGGWPGALLLMGGYVVPSFLLMLVFAVLYETLRGVMIVDAALVGLSPAVVAVVAAVTISLVLRLVARAPDEGPGAAIWRAKGGLLAALVALVAVAGFGIGAPEVILLWGAISLARKVVAPRLLALAPLALPMLPAAAPGSRLEAFGHVVGVFLATGATTFGGGYVMVPVLERQLVHAGWIGAREFVDAVALGQVTPGPVVITATFVGYRVAGLAGAVFGTAAVFAPGFLLALVLASSMERVRRHPMVQAFLAGLTPAIAGVMAAAVVSLAKAGLHDWIGWVIAAVALAVLVTRRAGNGTVLLGSALLGVIVRWAGLRN